MAVQVIQGDALNELNQMKTGSIDFIYVDPPFNTGRKRKDYADSWGHPRDYANWLNPVIHQWHRVLTPTGGLVVHLDYRATHYVREMIDAKFGWTNLQNEIIWSYSSGGASKKHLSRKHDNLLWYTKMRDNYTFNEMREPYATPNVDGRKGFHPNGRLLTDVWNIPIMSTTSKERVGYDTQKPLKLLDRVIKLFTNPGDTVLDNYCGSGTTGVACAALGRNAILIDNNPDAVRITQARLSDVSAV